MKLDFRCCKLANKTGGRAHDLSCTGRPPDIQRKKKIVIGSQGVELIEDPLYKDIEPADLAGIELTETRMILASQDKFEVGQEVDNGIIGGVVVKDIEGKVTIVREATIEEWKDFVSRMGDKIPPNYNYPKYFYEVKMTTPTFEKSRIFTIKLESQFIPTPTMVKQKLGIGYKVLAVEVEKEASVAITSVDSAVDAMIKTGYRALVRAFHPDFGGDPEVMVVLNRAKKEVDDLLKEVRG